MEISWTLARTVKVGLQVMLRYHRSFDGGATVGQEVDVAAFLFYDPAHCHGAHLQDR